MDFQKLANIKLIQGAGGGDPRNGLCIMEMVSYFDGADHVTDHPDCACRALTEYAIRLNDTAPTQALRDQLKPLLPMLTGSRDEAARAKRVEHLVFQTARRIVAPLYEKHWPHHAQAIRAAQTYTDLQTACAAAAANADAAAANANAAAANAAAANAAAANAAAANAAAAAAYAAYAVESAAYAAYAVESANAAAAAAAYAATREKIWLTAKDILTETIALGEHGKLDMEAEATMIRAEQLLALVKG